MSAFKLACLWSILFSLGACSQAQFARTDVFQDQLFVPKSAVLDARDIFKLSPEMRQYLASDFTLQQQNKSRASALHAALYSDLKLKLDHDAHQTRTAAEAFASRSANCLSLVIMTAALAKALDLEVYFHAIETEENWLQRDDLFFSTGHVNLTIGKRPPLLRHANDARNYLTIDFAPVQNYKRARPLTEQTIVAMYMNNRAAESLAEGKLREAYWWAKSAIAHDASFLPTYIALAVIYRRSHHPELAELSLQQVLRQDPDNITALSNLTFVLADLQRKPELAKVVERLKQLRPYQPCHFFKIGKEAMRSRNYPLARDMFLREVGRQPNNHQFYFQLAIAYAMLGETRLATLNLSKALANSTTLEEQGLYAAKLAKIRAR